MNLPEEPMMLYSFINMKLRDSYPSLDALCEDLNVEKDDIVRKLNKEPLLVIAGGQIACPSGEQEKGVPA